VIRLEGTSGVQSDAEKCAELVRSQIGDARIDVGLVLGAWLAAIADQVSQPVVIPYDHLPGFAHPAGDEGTLVIGLLGTARVAIFRGRANYNDKGDINAMRVPIEMLSLLGAKSVVLTSAAGSVRNDINPGTLVTITDHINLTGLNPLIGESGRERSVDMSDAYDRHLRERFALACGQLGRKIHEAVYMWLPGPSFETAAEIRAAQALGAHVVGMAIVPETILARRYGLRVLALGMVTNLAAGLRTDTVTHEDRMRTGVAAAGSLARVLTKFFEIWMVESRVLR
jgi:purine-nucleoside phosphorylase